MRRNDEKVDVFVNMIVIVKEEEDLEWRGGRRRWKDGRGGGGARGGRVGGRVLRWASRGARSRVVALPKEAERSSGSARGQCG